jgi:hypothetical protein
MKAFFGAVKFITEFVETFFTASACRSTAHIHRQLTARESRLATPSNPRHGHRPDGLFRVGAAKGRDYSIGNFFVLETHG